MGKIQPENVIKTMKSGRKKLWISVAVLFLLLLAAAGAIVLYCAAEAAAEAKLPPEERIKRNFDNAFDPTQSTLGRLDQLRRSFRSAQKVPAERRNAVIIDAIAGSIDRMLQDFSCSKLYLGVDGIDLEYGLSTTNLMEAGLNRVMIRTAQKTIVLADSSKFGRRGFSKICELEAVDRIITDSGVQAPSDTSTCARRTSSRPVNRSAAIGITSP